MDYTRAFSSGLLMKAVFFKDSCVHLMFFNVFSVIFMYFNIIIIWYYNISIELIWINILWEIYKKYI